MIKVSKKAQYGLRAMVLLAKNYSNPKGTPRVLSVREMANMEAIPYGFLEKIILQLEKANLVKAKKGALGGYILTKSPKKISANDVVSVLEENKETVDCAFCGRNKKCQTKDVWSKLDKALNKTLQKITLAELIK